MGLSGIAATGKLGYRSGAFAPTLEDSSSAALWHARVHDAATINGLRDPLVGADHAVRCYVLSFTPTMNFRCMHTIR